MEPSPIVPQVALVIKLSSTEPAGSSSLFRRLGLPATWVIDRPSQATGLGEAQLATSELALAVKIETAARFQSELSNRLAAVQAAAGQQTSAVYGDPRELRARASVLADLGVTAVIADSLNKEAKPPKQLPCGLWQLDAAMKIPQPRSRWALLPARRANLKQVLNAASPIVIEITSGEISRSERLLDEISQAARAGQVVVSTVSEIAESLVSQHEVKPQRSILRVAA